MRYKHFTKDERHELSILLKRGYSLREIASVLKKSPSSVSREVRRHRLKGQYQSGYAEIKAGWRRRNAKYQGMKIRQNRELRAYVEGKLRQSWSPEQIAGRIRIDLGIAVHHTTIYRYLYSVYGQSLCRHLRYRRHKKRRRLNSKAKREIIKNRVFIDQRPEYINQRERFGDFEGDTLGVPRYTSSTVAALIERKSRFILGQKVDTLKNALQGFKQLLQSLPVLSLTLDNGPENAHYRQLNLPTYFCHPYHSWEKGSIEQAFGLIREYIPKKRSLLAYSQDDITAIIDTINSRPRKCLQWRTPKEVFYEQFLNQECCT